MSYKRDFDVKNENKGMDFVAIKNILSKKRQRTRVERRKIGFTSNPHSKSNRFANNLNKNLQNNHASNMEMSMRYTKSPENYTMEQKESLTELEFFK
mmetsp:Transcript_19026/g.16859  ORF Transcript_19026/g.16859 Transcript_19026/m.16859 type:complete len:97 (+) Transcript_19026:1-291(+)